jgi:hypothetical protein
MDINKACIVIAVGGCKAPGAAAGFHCQQNLHVVLLLCGTQAARDFFSGLLADDVLHVFLLDKTRTGNIEFSAIS